MSGVLLICGFSQHRTAQIWFASAVLHNICAAFHFVEDAICWECLLHLLGMFAAMLGGFSKAICRCPYNHNSHSLCYYDCHCGYTSYECALGCFRGFASD